MNLKEIKQSSTEIEKRHWVYVPSKKSNFNHRFISVPSKMGPEVFALIIVERNQEIVITNNYIYIVNTMRYSHNNSDGIRIEKGYSTEDYFNYSTLYNLPTPQELKEIRQYYKKNHKNHQLTVYLGTKGK